MGGLAAARDGASEYSPHQEAVIRDVLDVWGSRMQESLVEASDETLEVDNPMGSSWVDGNWHSTPRRDLSPPPTRPGLLPAPSESIVAAPMQARREKA